MQDGELPRRVEKPWGHELWWRSEPGQVHTIEALEDAIVVEVSTPELDDVVRLADDYGRTGA